MFKLIYKDSAKFKKIEKIKKRKIIFSLGHI